MLIAWMIYAVAIATIVAGSAIALERIAEIWGFSRRPIWIAALTASILLPAGLALRPAQASRNDAVALLGPVRIAYQGATGAMVVRPAASAATADNHSFLTSMSQRIAPSPIWNQLAGAAWLAVSFVLGTVLCRGAIALWRRRAEWSTSIVDGRQVLLTQDVGPAVVGIFRPRILLPSWALALEGDARALMLEHEAEHVRANDPVLIAIAAWAVALFPWNPAVWLIVRRLRVAIEIDCDRRVLSRRTAHVREYGMLLLTVSARSASALRFGASLAEPRRSLEQRILAMTTSRPSRPIIASVPFVAISLLAVVAVAQTPRPESTLVVRQTPPRIAQLREPGSEPEQRIIVPPKESRVPFPRVIEKDLLPYMRPSHVAPPVPVEPPAVRTPPLSIEVIRTWIQLHHPNVIAGDPQVNAVTIVVDQNNQYLASVADSIPGIAFAGDTVSVRLRGTLRPVSALTPRPVIVVDGIRVDSAAQLDTISIDGIDVLKGRYAAAQYGPEAEQGVIAITSMRPDPSQLTRLGLTPDNIGEMSELRLRSGVVGPNRLYVAVLQLKKY
jgi:beta-lactamase regulating signal transducer with metallopeptidase domain